MCADCDPQSGGGGEEYYPASDPNFSTQREQPRNVYRNVTASYGVEGFTEDHLAAFKRYGTERVLIAYDRDAAGEKAVAALAEKLIACGLECFRIHFPKGMDANEYALTVKPAEKSLGVPIRSAIWLGGKSKNEAGSAGVSPAMSAPARTELSLSSTSLAEAEAQAALAPAGETPALPAIVASSPGQAASPDYSRTAVFFSKPAVAGESIKTGA